MKQTIKTFIEKSCEYYTRENPNNDMITDGYSVIAFDCINTYYSDPDVHCGYNVREYIYETKEEAWLAFSEDLFEYGAFFPRDFWSDVYWDAESVCSVHFDEGGSTDVFIEKWEGFDDDIQISWKYNGVKYKTYKDLWEAEPKFNGCYMETDKPWIRHKGDPAGEDMAHLDITLSESFEKSCKEKEKELKDNKKKWKEEREAEKKKWEAEAMNFDDLPF